MHKRNPMPVRLLIADDHQLLREGFCKLFNDYKNIKIIGEASDGVELVELAGKLKPDIVITDIKMPKMDGIEATRILTEKYPHIHILALTVFQDEIHIINMLNAGAKGYLTKNTSKEEVLEAVEAILENKPYYSQETNFRLALYISKSKSNPWKKRKEQEFSKREKDIIRLICEEHCNREIAEKLSLSVRTVEGHREKILEKMHVKNTAGIVVYAIRHHLYLLEVPQ